MILLTAALGARCGTARLIIRRGNFTHDFNSRLLFFLRTPMVMSVTVVVSLSLG